MGAAIPGGRYGVLVAGIGGLGTRGLLIKGAPGGSVPIALYPVAGGSDGFKVLGGLPRTFQGLHL